MDTNWQLQSSIHLLNNFCADTETFSYRALAHLKLEGLILRVNTEARELTMVVSTDPDYQTLRSHLKPDQRLYQLLGLHFRIVQILYGLRNEPIEKAIQLETISLLSCTNSTDVRDPNSLGSKLRRALNVALQGHISMLWLQDENDIQQLKNLWMRARVTQLLEEHGIMHCYNFTDQVVKLWKPSHPEEGERIIITIK